MPQIEANTCGFKFRMSLGAKSRKVPDKLKNQTPREFESPNKDEG